MNRHEENVLALGEPRDRDAEDFAARQVERLLGKSCRDVLDLLFGSWVARGSPAQGQFNLAQDTAGAAQQQRASDILGRLYGQYMGGRGQENALMSRMLNYV